MMLIALIVVIGIFILSVIIYKIGTKPENKEYKEYKGLRVLETSFVLCGGMVLLITLLSNVVVVRNSRETIAEYRQEEEELSSEEKEGYYYYKCNEEEFILICEESGANPKESYEKLERVGLEEGIEYRNSLDKERLEE